MHDTPLQEGEKTHMHQLLRVLVAEDEALIAMVMRRYLTQLGCEVVDVVADGPTAADIVRAREIDLMVMDINLRGSQDGIETVASLSPHPPVIYASAYGDEDTRTRAAQTRPIAFLTKPVALSDLRDALSRLPA